MAKGNNNLRSKKPHSSKPYDVSNSFVKKVTSGVSSLLPQSSWLSRWFASSSTVEEDKPSTSDDGDNHGEEQDTQSPPCKRARIPLNRPFPANSFRVSSPIDRGETHPWPSESVASPIPNVFSDSAIPGPSGLARTPIAASNFQSPNLNTESLEGKVNGDGGSDSSESTSGCSSLAPQRVTPNTSSAVHKTPVSQKLANHSQFSLFPSATHKLSPTINSSVNRRRPSFNVSSFGSPNLDSSKLSRETSLNSPFYIGRTMYGGASAYRRPREGVSSESLMSSSRRGGVTVRPVNEKTQSGPSAEATMSQTARRILEALEQFSSPVSEARRMPLPPQPPLSAKRKRALDLTSPVKSSNPPAAALNPLTIPMPPERLRLHRLQDATEAARRVASSRSNVSGSYFLRTDNETIQHKEPGKVTKSKPLDEDERVLPVNLPNIPLAITTLPSFDLFSSPAQSVLISSTRTNVPLTAAKSDQTSVSAEVESSKVSSGTSSSVASLSNSSKIDTIVATTSSGMNPINFMPKSSSKMTNFKFTTDSSDTFQTNCIRKSDNISNKLSSSNKLNSKTVSFSDSLSRSPFSNISTSSANNTKSNEFVFSTPKVLPTANFKGNTESKVNSFYFCKPEVLELTKCDNKVNREEPNGFRKHSSKSGDNTDVPLIQKSVNKEVAEKSDANTESLCVSGNPKLKSANPIENNGWGAKFVLPESWECSSCMVRNKKDIEVCVCCGGEKQKPASSVVSNDLTVNSGQSGSLPTSGWGNKFQLQPDMWECSICLVRNKETESNCVSCTSARSANNKSKQKDSQAESWGSQFKMSSDLWECAECFVRNKQQDVKCISCTTPRSTSGKNGDVKSGTVEPKKSGNDWGQKFKKSGDNWECPVCMIQNKESILKCAACEEPKPGLDKNRVATGSSIKFNFEIPSSASSFKFGIDQADAKVSEGSILTSFQFGSGKSDTTSAGQNKFSFGKSETKISSGFTFGIPQSISSSTSVSTSTAPSKSDGNTFQSPNKISGDSPAASFAPPKSSESPKVGGFTFGVSSSSTVSASLSGDSAKTNTNKSGNDGNSSLEKDVKFGVSHASPVALNSGNKNTTVTSISKSGQSSSADNKAPSFNLTAPTSKPAAFNFTTNITSTTNTVPVTSSLPVAATTSAFNSESTNAIPSTSSIFSFGGTSGQSTFSKPLGSSSPSFAFKGPGSQPSTGSIFAAPSQSQFKAPGEGLFSTKTPVSTAIPAFENQTNTLPKTTSVQSFGPTATTVAAPTATTTTSVPSFTTAHATVFANVNKSSNEFGNGSTKPLFANASTSFGPITTTSTTVNTPVTTSTVSSTSGATPSFVVPATASFGVHVTTVGASVTSPTFGTTAASTNFGLPTSTVVATSNSSSFGASAPVKFGTPATTSNSFGGTNAPSTFNTTASSIFGSTNTPSFGTSTTPGFSSNSATPNFGSSFSTVTTTAPAFGAPSPVVLTVSSTPSVQVFGGFSNPVKPAPSLFSFGPSAATTTPGSNFSFNSTAQTAATQPTGSSTPVFGFGSANSTNVTSSTTTTPTASAASATAAAPAAGFGGFSFTPASGTPAPSASGLFSNNAVSVFGSPATSTPSATSFGAGNSASSTVFRPQTFNFGSGGTQQPFSFGSGAQSGANQAGSNTTFSFGQSQVPAQPQTPQFNPNLRPSFNFTGGETPQFTASAPSATPTPQRRVKKAVRRTQRQ